MIVRNIRADGIEEISTGLFLALTTLNVREGSVFKSKRPATISDISWRDVIH